LGTTVIVTGRRQSGLLLNDQAICALRVAVLAFNNDAAGELGV